MNIPSALEPKYRALADWLLRRESVAIGFSGGVDSTFLAAVCARVMPERTVLIHLDSPLVGTPEREMFARGVEQLGIGREGTALQAGFADPAEGGFERTSSGEQAELKLGERGADVEPELEHGCCGTANRARFANPTFPHASAPQGHDSSPIPSLDTHCPIPRLVTLPVNPLEKDTVASNPPERCYHCKRLLFTHLIEAARAQGCSVVLDGSNADDALDYRPGMQALQELGVESPLMECSWHKDEERAVLRAWGFDAWGLPAGACLATRIACGERITREGLELVRACEDFLHRLGARQVRTRLSRGLLTVSASEEDRALLADGAGELRAPVREGLASLGAAVASPFVQTYRHGETSVRTA